MYFIEICPAGYQILEGHLECSACPPDMYKKEVGSSRCVPCASATSTDGKSGATSCKGT